MDWDDLRYVLAVSRGASLSSAARALRVNHTTVSRRLGALEQQLGVRLFDRTPDGFVATSAGADLIATAERVEDEVLALDRQVLGHDTRLSGRLRFTSIDIFVIRHAPDLTAFQRKYPGVELDVRVTTEFSDIGRREADVALRMTNTPPEHLLGRKIGRVELALYAARDLASRHDGQPFEAWPWIGWQERFGAKLSEQRMLDHAPKARVVARFDTTSAFMAGLRAGLGIGFSLCVDADPDPELVRLASIEPDFGMDVWLLTHKDLRNTARVRAFLDHMHDALLPWKSRFRGE